MNYQLNKWKGKFGIDYISRNPLNPEIINMKFNEFQKIFYNNNITIKNILEVGCNIGLNISALQYLVKDIYAIEPNTEAYNIIKSNSQIKMKEIQNSSADNINYKDYFFDLVFTCTVLIHLDDDALEKALNEIHRVSKKYILLIEYFSPKREMITYQNEKNLLFKRDYGEIFLNNFKNVKLIDYGFLMKRFSGFDDCNFWLFEKF